MISVLAILGGLIAVIVAIIAIIVAIHLLLRQLQPPPIDALEDAAGKMSKAAERMSEEATKMSKLLDFKNPLSNWNWGWTETRHFETEYWIATCSICRTKNRLRSKEIKGARCGKCGLPFGKFPGVN